MGASILGLGAGLEGFARDHCNAVGSACTCEPRARKAITSADPRGGVLELFTTDDSLIHPCGYGLRDHLARRGELLVKGSSNTESRKKRGKEQ